MGTGKNILNKAGILGELISFLRLRGRWWLIPIVIILVLFGVLLLLGTSTPVAPFIYSLF